MTTAAQPAPLLDVSSTDVMDLHSDAGHDLLGDDDLDFDMGSTSGNPAQEDDVLSLQDAAVDESHDSQDDLMVDKEDVIEEEHEYDNLDFEIDPVDYAATGVDQGTPQPDTNIDTPIVDVDVDIEIVDKKDQDDDIIDYSDDEDQLGDAEPVVTQPQGHSPVEASATATQLDHALGEAVSPSVTSNLPQQQDVLDSIAESRDVDDQNVEVSGGLISTAEELEPKPLDDVVATVAHDEVDQGDEAYEDGQLKAAQYSNTEDALSQDDPAVAASTQVDPSDTSVPEAQAQVHAEAESSKPLHPITLNYDGSEFWLFKPHNGEEGDWLLEDEQAATQPFPYLFHACRAQLGDDIGPDTELGIRFDHLHALELYEDCTACAYTSLQDLVDVYLALHAQDGNTAPDSFYMTFQFRPRVLTLVNELKKAVSENIGFTGLDAAIAAGQSSFKSGFATNVDDTYDEDWGIEEQTTLEEQEQTPSEEEAHDGAEEPAQEQHLDSAQSQVAADEPLAAVADNGGLQDDAAPAEEAYEGNEGPNDREEDSPASHAAEIEDYDNVDDIIDYTDDEDANETSHEGTTTANEPSPSSSTVQGDEASEMNAASLDPTNPAEQFDEDGASYEEPYDYNADVNTQDDQGQVQNVVDVDDEGPDLAQSPAGDKDNLTADFEAANTYDDDADVNAATEAQNDNVAFSVAGHEMHAGDVAADESTVVDDFLDFGEPTYENDDNLTKSQLEVEEEEEIGYDDEEDATGHEADAASRIELDDSQSALKRSIDEVDAASEAGASDTSDAKRPKL